MEKKLKIEVEEISVVIPTLNRCFTLQRAIESVLQQALMPCEVIVVDNGSSDGTLELIKSKYPTVRILHEKKIGVSAARNRGIKAAQGRWVALLDSDDEWLPNKLRRQMESYIDCGKSVRVIHTNELWRKNNLLVNQLKKHKKTGGNIFIQCLLLCCISPSSVLLRKDLFNDFGCFDENLPACEDYDLWLRICSKEDVLFVDENLIIKYGGHDDQLSHRYWAMDRFRVFSLEKLIGGGDLSMGNRTCAYEVLMAKLNVLISGGLKRRNMDLVNFYSKKKEFWIDRGNDPQNKKDNQCNDLNKELDYYRD
jgi:glycosyltransferase involved in cell wall biosynthesis